MPVKPDAQSKSLTPGQFKDISKKNQQGYFVQVHSIDSSFTVKYDEDFTITRVSEKIEWLANYEIDSSNRPVQYQLILKPLSAGTYVILKEKSSTSEPLEIIDKKGDVWRSKPLNLQDPSIGIK